MSKKKYVWEVYLRPNTLTKENDRDCIADVHAHADTQHNSDIADIITKERTEFRKETILNILAMRDKAVKDLIQEGLSFMDGLVQISPRVSGVWETENTAYDEKVHKRTVDLIPTADLRTALDAIGVKVLGAKEQSARITAVTDTATGLKDGTLTIGDDIIIDGEKLKIDETDSAQGVFFKAAGGTEYKTTRRLSVNNPSQIIARVPKEVPAGAVTLIVRTK
nr:DNA-binding domain-containing protein [Treponema pedis]